MKQSTIILGALLCTTLLSTQAADRHVYVKLYADDTAWTHVTAEDNHVIITLPEGSTDFAAHVLPQLQAGDEVWVAKGVYDNTATLTLMDNAEKGWTWGNITLYGGFAGTETEVNQRAVEDKDGNGLAEPWELVNETNFKGKGNDAENASGFQLIHLGTGAVMDGVTLSDNYYKANQAAGGVVEKEALLRNSILRNLTAEGTGTVNGGGLYVTAGCIESCLFEGCEATGSNTSFGGALLIYGMSDNVPDTPTGYMRNSVIRNCSSTAPTGRGGAVFGKGGVIIENCVMYNNFASTNGSAFYFHKVGDNSSHVNRVIGCTMVNNQSAHPVFPECTYVEIYNSVSWGNARPDGQYKEIIRCAKNGPTAYPYWDGFAYHGTVRDMNNKNADFVQIELNGAIGEADNDRSPRFTRPTSFAGVATSDEQLEEIRTANWTLQPGSPLMDAGVNVPTNRLEGYDQVSLVLAAFSANDLMGNARDDRFDLGAYEYVSEGPGTGIGTPAQKPFELYTTDRRITICNLEVPATISVYALNGMCLHDQQAYAASCTVSVFEPGCYLLVVRMGERTYCEKVLL